MASPQPGGGSPKMPRQPKIIVDPIVPKQPSSRKRRPRSKDIPTPLPGPGEVFPQPMPYAPIKQTKAVNPVYKTY